MYGQKKSMVNYFVVYNRYLLCTDAFAMYNYVRLCIRHYNCRAGGGSIARGSFYRRMVYYTFNDRGIFAYANRNLFVDFMQSNSSFFYR